MLCSLCQGSLQLAASTKRTLGTRLVIIVQGGEHPRIFSPAICSYISKGSGACEPDIDEVPNPVVRNSLKQVLRSFMFSGADSDRFDRFI